MEVTDILAAMAEFVESIVLAALVLARKLLSS